MKKLILINGLKRSGKDFTCEKITEYVGAENVATAVFASPIKEIMADTLGITVDNINLYKNESENYGIKIMAYPENLPEEQIGEIDFRKILQVFGTEAMKKHFGDDVWAKIGVDKVTASKKEWNIIPDFRFVSEFEEAKRQAELEGYEVITILVKNNDIPDTDLHASERDLKDHKFKFDFTINNTGQPDISVYVENIIENIKARFLKI